MLPVCRHDDYLYQTPSLDLQIEEVSPLLEDLRVLHNEFHDCFQRSETRENLFRYACGQLSPLARKSIEPIALAVENGNVRAIQSAISESPWDEGLFLKKYHQLVSQDLGSPEGVVIFDESGTLKKGKESAGVARQYSGTIGKVDNCQVGVHAAYASASGYCFLDKRLFLPEIWFSREYSQRRQKCRIPKELTFQTKPQLALEMLTALDSPQILLFKYVLGDSIYGNSPEFIDGVEALDKIYLVAVASDTQFWEKPPTTFEKDYIWKGKVRTKTILKNKTPPPKSLMEMAQALNSHFWYRRKASEGTKGPIEYEFHRKRITLAKNGLPWKTVWLLIKRTLGKEPEYSFYISNAPSTVKLATLVWLSGMRWPIEQCFGEAKAELGMDHYEVRKFTGWHHHMLITMLSHFFLWHLKIKWEKKHLP